VDENGRLDTPQPGQDPTEMQIAPQAHTLSTMSTTSITPAGTAANRRCAVYSVVAQPAPCMKHALIKALFPAYAVNTTNNLTRCLHLHGLFCIPAWMKAAVHCPTLHPCALDGTREAAS